jgi:hypothetical protein
MFVPQSVDDLHPEDVAKAAAATGHLATAKGTSCRAMFRVLIAELLEMMDVCQMSEAQRRHEFRVAFRWGSRSGSKYRIWRDEIALQRGVARGRITPSRPTGWLRQRQAEAAGQTRMFEA